MQWIELKIIQENAEPNAVNQVNHHLLSVIFLRA